MRMFKRGCSSKSLKPILIMITVRKWRFNTKRVESGNATKKTFAKQLLVMMIKPAGFLQFGPKITLSSAWTLKVLRMELEGI